MSESRQSMEHRWGTRVAVNAPATMRDTTGHLATAVVRNASLSGAFVETPTPFALLARVAVKAGARGGEWLHGCVVRVERNGIAIEWLDPDLQAVAALLDVRRAPQRPAAATPRVQKHRDVESARRLP